MSQPFQFNRNVNKSYITLGSNATSLLGTSSDTLKFALKQLAGDSVNLVRTSPFYSTPAFPKDSGPDFVNAAAALETSLDPQALLALLHAIENHAGRTRETRWAARGLDLDLVSHNNAICPDLSIYTAWRDLPLETQMRRAPEQLILPHPRLQDRAFALIPLRDVAPDWKHPVTGQSIDELIKALPAQDIESVQPLALGA